MCKYHSILGVSCGAEREEIDKAYLRMAKRTHPDVNRTKDATEKFVRIRKAYESLTESKDCDVVLRVRKDGRCVVIDAFSANSCFDQTAKQEVLTEPKKEIKDTVIKKWTKNIFGIGKHL